MPAAAVIPAPLVYIYAVAVKTFVVEFRTVSLECLADAVTFGVRLFSFMRPRVINLMREFVKGRSP